jgi:hypothetical protein
VCLALLIVVGLVAGLGPNPALAWGGHPLNTNVYYYMPGPPPGSWLTACLVRSQLTQYYYGDFATLLPYDDSTSDCYNGRATIVTYNQSTQQLEQGPADNCLANQICVSQGAMGQPVFGAHYAAMNIAWYLEAWQVTVL